MTLLGLTLLINSTLLNVNFVKGEVTNSSLGSVMLNRVNNSLAQCGVSTSVLKKSDTDKPINRAIDQAYAGEKISLDLSPIASDVSTSINSQLARYGLSTSMLLAGSSSAIAGNINSMVDSQLNAPEVAQLINGVKIVKMVVNIILIISIISLVILILKRLWQHHLVDSFRWICLWGTISYIGIVMTIRAIALQMSASQSDMSPLISRVTSNFQQTGFHGSMIMIVTSIVLFVLYSVKREWQPCQQP